MTAGTTGPTRRDAGRSSTPGNGARRARSTRRRPTAPWCRSRRTTTSASPTTPRSSPPRTTPSTAGARARARRGSSWARARCTTSSKRELADWKGTEARGALHHRLRRQPRRAHHVRRSRHAGVLRRAQPRVDHRRSPPRAARRSRSTATSTPPTSTSCCASNTRARAIVVSETTFSMDGDVAPVDKLRRRVRAPRRAARARRGPQRARPAARGAATTSTVLRVGTLSKTLGALGGFVAGPRRLHRPAGEPRPRRTSSPPRRVPPTPPPRSPRCASLRSPEGDALRARLRANVDRLRPGHPSPVVPVRVRPRDARARSRGRAARRAGSSSPRSGHRRCRRARRGCGSRSRPTTPSTRSMRSPRRSPSCSRVNAATAAHARVRGRHRDRGGQDLVDRGGGTRAPCRRGARRRPQAGAVGRSRRRHRRRPARRRHR